MSGEKEKFKDEFKKRVYRFTLDIIKFIDDLPQQKSNDVIGNQLLRSSTSIGANIVEATAASFRKDFTNFFNHALKSANESKYWLALLRDAGKAPKETCNKLLEETNQISNILASSILTLKGKK